MAANHKENSVCLWRKGCCVIGRKHRAAVNDNIIKALAEPGKRIAKIIAQK